MNTQIDNPQAPPMVHYRATRDFGMAGMTIHKGTDLAFDGHTLSVQGRPPQEAPQFRGALKVGWAVPVEAYDPDALPQRPVSAGIRVRPADTGNPNNKQASTLVSTAQDEEQVVGSVQAHADEVRQVNQRGRGVVAGIEEQDHKTVRTLGSPNTQNGERTTLTGTNAQSLISRSGGSPIQPGRGKTREELMAEMSPEQREQYEAQIRARRAAYVDDPPRPAVQSADAAANVVATLVPSESKKESMGITTTTTVGGGTAAVDLSGLDTTPAEPEVVEAEGMKFTTTGTISKPRAYGALQPPSIEDQDPRRVIAKSICKDFPDSYDFEAPFRKKLARLMADFEDRHDVIRAVAAAETDGEVRAALVKDFPEAFQS